MFKLLKTPKEKVSGGRRARHGVKPGVSWTQNFLVCDKKVQFPWAWSEKKKLDPALRSRLPYIAPRPLPTSLEVCLFYEMQPEEDGTGARPAREGAGGEEPASCPSWPGSHPRGRTAWCQLWTRTVSLCSSIPTARWQQARDHSLEGTHASL